MDGAANSNDFGGWLGADQVASPPDAVVIGGGVAGAASACALAAAGLRTTLFEARADDPARRMKCCGHCLHGRAVRPLARLGLLETVLGVAHGRTRALRLEHPPGESLSIRAGHGHVVARASPGGSTDGFPDGTSDGNSNGLGEGFIVRRDELDPALRRAAIARGVRVIAAAARYCADDGSVRWTEAGDRTGGERGMHPAIVVGADGISSRVARDAGLVETQGQGRRYGVAFDIPRSTPGAEFLCGEGEIRMIVAPRGYLGLVRERDVVHAGMLLDAGVVAREALAWFVARDPSLAPLCADPAPLLQAGGAGPIPFRVRRAARGNLVLVGDAAGYVEPFTGEGMTWALESAAALADALADAREDPAGDAAGDAPGDAPGDAAGGAPGASPADARGGWTAESIARVPAIYERMRARSLDRTTLRCRTIAWVVARPRLVGLALRGASIIGRIAPDAPRRIAQGVIG